MEVKLYTVAMPGKYKADLEDAPDFVRALYEAHSSFNDSWYYEHYTPEKLTGMTKDEWKEKAKDPEQRAVLVEQWPRYSDFTVQLQAFKYLQLVDAGYNLTVSNVTTMELDHEGLLTEAQASSSAQLEASLKRQITQMEKLLDLGVKGSIQLASMTEQHFNQKCGVPVSQWLNNVNSLFLLEDACSDWLQTKLNEGWRILAVMPQPDQRRPDYLLGKVAEGEELRKIQQHDSAMR